MVAIRVYNRWHSTRRLGLDDHAAILSLICTMGMSITMSVFIYWYVSGRIPKEDFTLFDVENALFLFWINEVFYNTAWLFIKMTFLLQYYRVFQYYRPMKIAYIVAMAFVGLWCLGQILTVICLCVPVQAYWDLSLRPNAHCIYSMGFLYVNAGGTILTDLIVLLIPVPAIWNLRTSRAQKWAIFGIFATGGIVPLVSIGRVTSIYAMYSNDFVSSGCWSIAELCMGIITAALATIRIRRSRKIPAFGRDTSSDNLRHAEYPHRLGSLSFADSTRKFQGGGTHGSTGSQSDLVHGVECELQDRTPNHSMDWQKGGSRYRIEQGSWLADPDTGAEGDFKASDLDLRHTTQPLHFGVDKLAKGTGVSTQITTGHENSLSGSGVEFLNTFGIVVQTDLSVQESRA
ncbi:hypothetical protein BX600DRAFT_109331 [Xylariales sp. PMI_506]|nr:hypothetical protein BX600DRAFT_109331 [Xylariales sp. PMI_506]